MTAWKTEPHGPLQRSKTQLQWGHADDGVEDVILADLKSGRFELQWGHADDGVEDVRGWRPQYETSSELQWGHADVGAEDLVETSQGAGLAHASMCGKDMHFRSLTGPSSKITIARGCPSPARPGERAAQFVSFCSRSLFRKRSRSTKGSSPARRLPRDARSDQPNSLRVARGPSSQGPPMTSVPSCRATPSGTRAERRRS
jgi:hypothetical protein